MTLATFHGRIQTKLLTYVILALVTALFWLTGGVQIFFLFLVAMLVGLALEGLWGLCICHQPGWLTFVFTGVEFAVIVTVAAALGITVPLWLGVLYYSTAWILTQLFLLYVLPVWKTDWADNGRELW